MRKAELIKERETGSWKSVCLCVRQVTEGGRSWGPEQDRAEQKTLKNRKRGQNCDRNHMIFAALRIKSVPDLLSLLLCIWYRRKTGVNTEPHVRYHIVTAPLYSKGATLEEHIAAWQLKKQHERLRATSQPANQLIQQRRVRAGVCLSPCETDFTRLSQSAGLSVKDTPKPLWKVWRGDDTGEVGSS